LNFTGGYSGCKVGEFVRFIKNVGGNLVDRKIGNLIAEEVVELCDIFEHGDDFGHECTDILVVFVIRQCDEILDVDD